MTFQIKLFCLKNIKTNIQMILRKLRFFPEFFSGYLTVTVLVTEFIFDCTLAVN